MRRSYKEHFGNIRYSINTYSKSVEKLIQTIQDAVEVRFVVVDFEAMRVAFYSAAEGTTGQLIEELGLPMPGPVE